MIKKFTEIFASLVLSITMVAIYPATAVLADTPPVCPQVNGTTAPTGSSAATFKYNANTCLWENDYYTWNPVTKIYTPKFSTDFVYNSADGQYEYTNWVYNASQDKYVPVVVVKPVAVSPTPQSSSGSSGGNNPSSTTASAGNTVDPSNPNNPGTTGNSILSTGPNSTNAINNTNQNNALLNLNYDAKMNNNLNQSSQSGNTNVLGNTVVGNAQTGDATNVANVMNMLQSTYNMQPAANFVTFTANINGNVNGDLLLDPSKISLTGPDSSNLITTNTNNNLTVNTNGSGLINNNIKANSNSGNVTVSQNTQAGNATSGNTNTVANVVNVLNTAIAAGKSFVGVININGNLNGDILLPPNFLDRLIASGAPSSTVTLNQQQTNILKATMTNNATINNNVNLAAASGNTSVSQNTSVGNVSSGNATTNLTVFNLTGEQVIGANSLMVFVNVLGKWVGLIMDAPSGANSAALCGGSCQISSITNNTANINSTANNTINNNIDLSSRSGDVSANQNTKVGNVSSGNATASANIMNFINSKLSMSQWFGLLFINVFGTWNGSFGINTEAGSLTKAYETAATISGGLPAQVFQFLPKDNGGFALSAVSNHTTSSHHGTQSGLNNIGSTGNGSNNSNNNFGLFGGGSTTSHSNPTASHHGNNLVVPILSGVAFLAVMSIGGLGEYGGRLRDNLLARRVSARQQGRQRAWLRFTLF